MKTKLGKILEAISLTNRDKKNVAYYCDQYILDKEYTKADNIFFEIMETYNRADDKGYKEIYEIYNNINHLIYNATYKSSSIVNGIEALLTNLKSIEPHTVETNMNKFLSYIDNNDKQKIITAISLFTSALEKLYKELSAV